MIQLVNFNKKISRESSFKNLDLSFYDSSLNSIIIQNELEKSILINIFACLEVCKKGHLFIEEKRITKRNVNKFRNSRVSYLKNDDNFLADLTIKENFDLCFELCKENNKNDILNDLYKTVGLDNDEEKLLNCKEVELSSFQKFKFGLIKSLIKKPMILIVDLSCINLSSEEINKALEILKGLSKKITILIFTSRLIGFENEYDQIIEIKNGQLNTIKNNKKNINSIDSSKNDKIGLLSLKTNIKFAKKYILNKKGNCCFSMVMSLISIILFVFMMTFNFTDTNKILLQKQFAYGNKDTIVTNYINYLDNSSYFPKQYENEFLSYQVSIIERNDSIKTYPIVELKTLTNKGSNNVFNKQIVNKSTVDCFDFFTDNDCAIEVDEKFDCLKTPDELDVNTKNSLPNSYDEISINIMLAKLMLKNGLIIDVYDPFNNHIFYPNKIDDLIGKTTVNGYKIVGIFSCGDKSEQYFDKYLYENPNFNNSRDKEYFNKMAKGKSISQYVYVKKGYGKQVVGYNDLKTPISYVFFFNDNVNECLHFLKTFEYKNRFGRVENSYSGFVKKFNEVKAKTKFIMWCIVVCIIFLDLIVSIILSLKNSKLIKKELYWLKSNGVSKLEFFIYNLVQNFMIKGVATILSLIFVLIIFLIFNFNLQFSILHIGLIPIISLLSYFAFVGLFVSFIASKKEYKNKYLSKK